MNSRSANQERLQNFLNDNPVISSYMRECHSVYQKINDTEYSDQFKIDMLLKDLEHMQQCINNVKATYQKSE